MDLLGQLEPNRAKLVLYRIQSLCKIDPNIISKEQALNWLPFSLIPGRIEKQSGQSNVDDVRPQQIRMNTTAEIKERILNCVSADRSDLFKNDSSGAKCKIHYHIYYGVN